MIIHIITSTNMCVYLTVWTQARCCCAKSYPLNSTFQTVCQLTVHQFEVIFLKCISFLYMGVFPACMYVCSAHMCLVPIGARDVVGFSGIGFADTCELAGGCWELKSGPL